MTITASRLCIVVGIVSSADRNRRDIESATGRFASVLLCRVRQDDQRRRHRHTLRSGQHEDRARGLGWRRRRSHRRFPPVRRNRGRASRDSLAGYGKQTQSRLGPCQRHPHEVADSAGISLGTSLRELERANGGPFRLVGFGSDVQGTILPWQSERLGGATVDGCRVRIRLAPDWRTIDQDAQRADEATQGRTRVFFRSPGVAGTQSNGQRAVLCRCPTTVSDAQQHSACRRARWGASYGSAQESLRPPSWQCPVKPAEACFKHHGRLSSQNGIAYKIWLIGTDAHGRAGQRAACVSR